MRFFRGVTLVSVVVAVAAGVCFAELSAGQKMAARDLIKQLSSEEFRVREQAVARLVAIGPDVVELVKPLLESKDEELKLRAEMILKRIGEQHPEAPGVKAEAGEFDRQTGSLVTLKVTNAELKDVLAKISDQSGNKVLSVQEGVPTKPVTVNWEKMPYWKALDQLCEQEGMIYTFVWSQQGLDLRLMPSERFKAPTFYAGPVVFKITTSMKNRAYWGNGMWGARGDQLTYNIMVFWEDRLNPGWTGAGTLEKMTDEKGGELKATMSNAMGAWGMMGRARMMRGERTETGPGMTQMAVVVADYPATLVKVNELTGKLTFGYATGTQQLVIEDVTSKGEKSGRTGTTELKITEAQRQRGWTSLTAMLTVDGKPGERMDFGGGEYGVWLVDAEGKKYPGNVMQQFGGMRVVRGAAPGQAAGFAVAGRGNPPETPGRFQISFMGIPEEADILRLVYVFATKTTEEAYPFDFKEVPVP